MRATPVLMDLPAILELYDADQRRDLHLHGTRREMEGTVVRHVALDFPLSYVSFSRLTAATADDVIRQQREYFALHGGPVEWTVYSHDGPPDLQARLGAHGFEAEETETVVVLDLESMSPGLCEPVAHDIRRIRDLRGLVDVAASKCEDCVAPLEQLEINQRLQRELQEIPDQLSIYVGYCDGEPVGSGWMRMTPASPFASLWGGSTRPGFRNRGYYTALVAIRAQEARDRGARFLTVDAQSMSRPILLNLGFQELTRATPMVWWPNG